MKFLVLITLCVVGTQGQADVTRGCPATKTDEVVNCNSWGEVDKETCQSKNCIFCEENSVQCYMSDKGCIAVRGDFSGGNAQTIDVDENFPGLNDPEGRAIKFFMTGTQSSGDDAPAFTFVMDEGQEATILLDAWSYDKSALREIINGKGVSWPKAVQTGGRVYQKDTFHPMWARWTARNIEVGFGEVIGSDVFMAYKLSKVSMENVRGIKFSNKNPTTIEWKICQAFSNEECPAPPTSEFADCNSWGETNQVSCESKDCVYCPSNDMACYVKDQGCVAVRGDFKGDKAKTFIVDETFPGLNLPTSRSIKFFMTGTKTSGDDAPAITFVTDEGHVAKIMLASWSYSKSALRESINGTGVSWPKAVDTPDLYKKDSYQQMWAQWNATHIALGYGDEIGSDVFLANRFSKIRLENVQSIVLNNKGITTMEWKICANDNCKDVAVDSRVDCGYPGISESECLSNNCCFETSIEGVNWCFYAGK